MQAFLHGVVLAFGLILPLGVQNVFVFSQGAAHPALLRALPAVVTAAACDTLLIIMAVQGVSVLLVSVEWLKQVLLLSGFVFLVYMGWQTWKAAGRTFAAGSGPGITLSRQIGFAASVSLLNPHAILDTVGVIGTSSLQYAAGERQWFMLACIFVSWFWFATLAVCGRVARQTSGFVQRGAVLQKIAAAFMWGSALYMVYQAK